MAHIALADGPFPRWRYGVNVLAVAGQGTRLRERLKDIRFRVGDVLLLQGRTTMLLKVLPILGCLPLAERGVHLGQPRRIALSTGIFGAALARSATGLLPIEIAFVGAAATMVLVGLLSLRDAYESIDWPILVLLGGMIPVGQALESTGGAQLIADQILELGRHLPAGVTLAVVLAGTMFLSDLVHNASAAALMAAITISVAQGLGVSVYPFLDGGGDGGFLRLPDADRPSIEHPGAGTGRVSVRRLLAHGLAAGSSHHRCRHSAHPVVLAAWLSGSVQ